MERQRIIVALQTWITEEWPEFVGTDTGFKPVSMTVPVTTGPGVYRIVVHDEGDGIYDSNVLIDNIRFK